MFCYNCGSHLENGNFICPQCGTDNYRLPEESQKKKNDHGILALVFAIVSLVSTVFLGIAPLGIIMAFLAKMQLKKAQEANEYDKYFSITKALYLAGLITGIAYCVIYLVFIIIYVLSIVFVIGMSFMQI